MGMEILAGNVFEELSPLFELEEQEETINNKDIVMNSMVAGFTVLLFIAYSFMPKSFFVSQKNVGKAQNPDSCKKLLATLSSWIAKKLKKKNSFFFLVNYSQLFPNALK
jgi:hypothetical protein